MFIRIYTYKFKVEHRRFALQDRVFFCIYTTVNACDSICRAFGRVIHYLLCCRVVTYVTLDTLR